MNALWRLLPLCCAWCGYAWGAEGEVEPVDLWAELVRLVGYLLVVAALGLAATHLGKKLQPRLGSGPIRLLGGRNLAPGVGVRLIQVGSRAWLIGVTRERVSLLAELREEDVRAAQEEGA